MTELTDHSILKLSSHVKLKVDSTRKETFLLAPEKAIRLNITASQILGLMKENISLSKLKTSLSLQFGESFVSQEVDEFVLDMISNGWVELVD